jgi:hypothetical protein
MEGCTEGNGLSSMSISIEQRAMAAKVRVWHFFSKVATAYPRCFSSGINGLRFRI